MADLKEVTIQDVYNGYAEKATEKEPTLVDIANTYEIKFSKDFKGHLKGSKIRVSKVALDFYAQNDVIVKK